MLLPQSLHRAVRTRADTTGALLRALGIAALAVAGLLVASLLAGDGQGDRPRATPALSAPAAGHDEGRGPPLVLPAARDRP